MSLYRVTDTTAYLVCRCGREKEFVFADLKASVGCIHIPPCEDCKAQITLAVTMLGEAEMNEIPTNPQARSIVNKALHKRLCAAGQKTEELEATTVPEGLYFLVPESGEVTAPLHPIFAGAKVELESEEKRK